MINTALSNLVYPPGLQKCVFLNIGYLGFLKTFKNLKKHNLVFFRFLFLLCNLINKHHIQNKYNCCLSVSYIILYIQFK